MKTEAVTLSLEFTTRKECVATLRQWREDYAELSQEIRLAKKTIREHQKEQTCSYQDYTYLWRLQGRAHTMLEYREAHKVRSREIWNLDQENKG